MKFTDGYWQLRPGVTLRHATTVADVEVGPERLTAYAAVRRETTRGATLNSPLLTVELWAPAEGVIGVRLTHHAGRRHRGPDFALAEPVAGAGRTRHEDGVAHLAAGPLSARLSSAPGAEWGIEFLDHEGRTLTSLGPRGLGFATDADGRHFTLARLALGVGEQVYGLGERFTPFTRNGQTVDLWQADGGTSSEQAYKNVPFHLSSRGYGVFVNHPGLVSYEIGSEAVGQTQFSVEDQSLEFFVLAGPTPKQALGRYTALTGRPALPPAWSFGLWLSTSFTTSYDEETVTRFVEGMAERGIPLSVFHFDCFWMRGYQWCDFTWDPAVFPEPEAMLRRLKERHGLRICVWINPYIAQKSPLFAEGAERGYLLRTTDGDVWQWDQWQAGMGLVDFTNPEARAWYQGHLKVLLDQGVDCFKTDFGERVPAEGVAWHDGGDPARTHNLYTQLYNETVFDLLREERGEHEAVLFARSATTGGQRLPVHWGGDCESTFEAMAESLRGGLSLGLSGFGFWSHDIGGFEGRPSPELFTRWVQFGLLSSHSRLHGSTSYRVPWDYGTEAVDVTRAYTRLKHRLMPYLYRAALQAHEEGVPVMRAMLLEFPDDPACRTLDRQYMLGDDLLVAPVLDADGLVEYYVPEGTWTHLLTGERVTGPGWRREHHPLDTLPLLASPGSALPLAAHEEGPVSDWADEVTLRVHPGPEGTVTPIPRPDGTGTAATFTVHRTPDGLEITTDSALPWRVEVPGHRVRTATAGATGTADDALRCAAGTTRVLVEVEED
ncbi:alpha-xylosidase [Streptomyces sp. NPDC004959]|uniref:alpha-xylosidase n=1 Tax=Streptomyces sp. NPDC004959 TaxID=3154673 RepID=UPI0033BF5A28